MRRLILVSLMILSGLSSVVFAKGPRQYLDVYDFSKGVDTYHSSLSLPEGFVQDSNNVFFDAVAPVSKRQGFNVAWSTKNYSYTGLWTYTDPSNTTWQLVRSSDQITANNLVGSTILVATISINNLIGESNAFGNAYFVDKTQGVYFWNGTSTTYVSGSPKGSIISQFHNRLWVAGFALPNGNQLNGSKYYDGTTWATGVLDTDPVQYSIGLNDNFDNLTAEYVYLDTIYLFKNYTIFALYGFGQSSFQISQLTQECGCIDGGTIQTFNGGLKFVSLRGVEDFDGYHCKRISGPVKNKVDTAIQAGSFAQQSWVQSSQADFQSGAVSYNGPSASLSTGISIGDVTLASNTFVDDSTTDWNLGSFGTRIDTFTIPGSLTTPILYSTNFSSFGDWATLSSFCSNSFAVTDRATCVSGGSCCQARNDVASVTNDFFVESTVAENGGTSVVQIGVGKSDFSSRGYCIVVTGQTKIDLYKDADIVNGGCTDGSLLQSYTTTAFSSARIGFSRNSTTNELNVYKDGVIVMNGVDTTYTAFDRIYIYTFYDNYPGKAASIDDLYSLPQMGNFTSREFDTKFSTPSFAVITVSTSNTSYGSVSLAARCGTSPGGEGADVPQTNGSILSGCDGKRYVIYSSSISAFYVVKQFSVDTVNLPMYSTGTYYSAVHNISSINSWGNFNVDDATNNGTIAYFLRSSTNSFTVTSSTPAWTSQNKNAPISIATGTYFQMSSTFTITSATSTPTLNDFTFQWYTGNNPTPMASTVWDNRYWLSLTTNTADVANDAVLVLSSKGSWSPLDIHAGGFTQTKGVLYHADSTATGNIYQDNQGYADNGAAINSFIVTRDYSFGQLPADDYLYALYPTADNTGSCTMTFNYRTDRGSTTYNLGSPLLSEFSSFSAVRLPLPIDSSHQDFGQSFNFTIGTNDASCAWNFYGFQGVYKSRPVN